MLISHIAHTIFIYWSIVVITSCLQGTTSCPAKVRPTKKLASFECQMIYLKSQLFKLVIRIVLVDTSIEELNLQAFIHQELEGNSDNNTTILWYSNYFQLICRIKRNGATKFVIKSEKIW